MKTKQEQIDKMAQVMCAFCTEDKRCVLKYSAPCSEVASQDCTCKESAEELICKGYGDVSEYKSEIERLKAEIIKQDQAIIERNFELVELEEKVKQAQIDVLDKAKDLMDKYYVFEDVSSYFIDDFKELIKEVQNGEDKG